MSKPLIPRVDYQRIFRTIYSVLRNENGHILRSCEYFNIIGAAILQKHYGIRARPVAGIAAYRVSAAPNGVILYAHVDVNQLVLTDNGYHCWIQTDEWLIDFIAPLFPEIGKESGINCESRMMQRKLQAMKSSVDDLLAPGDFCAFGDADFTQTTLEKFWRKRVNHDLAEMCSAWYAIPPIPMAPVISVFDEKGRASEVALQRFEIQGVWE